MRINPWNISDLSTFFSASNFKVTGVVSVFFIVVSIVSFCLKTHPDMRVPLIRNVTVQTANNTFAWTLDKYQVRQKVPQPSTSTRQVPGQSDSDRK